MEDSTPEDRTNGSIRPPADVAGTDAPASYHALLKAAITHFAQKGFDGTRIEAVAREANYHKSLVYRHFGDKEGLFKAALRQKLDERIRMLPDSPLVLADVMYSYFTETLRDREYIRMIIGEAMCHDADAVIDEDWRYEYYRKHTELVKHAQKQGNLPDSIEPDFLMLMITSIILFPAALPQVAKMLTGYSPESQEFQQRWRSAVKSLEDALRLSITTDPASS
ncbi:MAG: helix-turn-helix domain-containing protein [Planctomycetaceae bacterium]|jgi:AcrR family transcriptional regulator